MTFHEPRLGAPGNPHRPQPFRVHRDQPRLPELRASARDYVWTADDVRRALRRIDREKALRAHQVRQEADRT